MMAKKSSAWAIGIRGSGIAKAKIAKGSQERKKRLRVGAHRGQSVKTCVTQRRTYRENPPRE
jgi:hypothetical protein